MKSGGDRAAIGSGGNCQFFSHRSSSLQNWYHSESKNEPKRISIYDIKPNNSSAESQNIYSPDISGGFQHIHQIPKKGPKTKLLRKLDEEPEAFCTDLWSDQLLPRVEAKAYGVPNLREVIYVQRRTVNKQLQLLIEVSKTKNGKFYITVFKRDMTKANEQRKLPPESLSSEDDIFHFAFDSVSVRELWQVEGL